MFYVGTKISFTSSKNSSRKNSHYRNKGIETYEALKDIEFPVKLTSVLKFKRKPSISINVYSCELIIEKLNIYVLYHTKNKLKKHINLLLIKN